jgi:hypothetical protein
MTIDNDGDRVYAALRRLADVAAPWCDADWEAGQAYDDGPDNLGLAALWDRCVELRKEAIALMRQAPLEDVVAAVDRLDRLQIEQMQCVFADADDNSDANHVDAAFERILGAAYAWKWQQEKALEAYEGRAQ